MKTLIVDANNVVMRAIHAMAHTGLSTDDGVLTGPLLAFMNTLGKHISEERPSRVAVCWDGGRSDFRLAIDPNYKGHRLQQESDFDEFKHGSFALAKEFCTLAGLMHVERPGFEADDLIAYYVRQERTRFDNEVVVLSSDKDFLQLVDHNVTQVRLSSYGTPTDRWDVDRVEQEYGCAPGRLPDVFGLAGDVSDNVPGVPRFGVKTAVKELTKVGWDWERLIREHPRVAEHEDQARRSRALVDLLGPVPGLYLPALPLFEPTRPGGAMYPLLVTFLRRFQMSTILTKVSDGTMWE